VLNLVLNGLDAMHEPGAGERTLVIRTARDGADAVAVSVQDAGIGIDEKNVDQLFHPFFTTKTEGLGMGLAIARTIVVAHGGRLGAVNNVTAGATFQFSLPVSREGAR
jgi:C4-dicarboxylate-specific signal transduction histidine kinase